jgi:hypothetical protein
MEKRIKGSGLQACGAAPDQHGALTFKDLLVLLVEAQMTEDYNASVRAVCIALV